MKMEFAQVQQNKANGQKFVNIRQKSLLQEGDWVKLVLVNTEHEKNEKVKK